MNFEKPPKLTVNEAMQKICAIEGMIAPMGANDSEFSDLEVIKEKLENNELTPEEAVGMAENIFSSKQDYH